MAGIVGKYAPYVLIPIAVIAGMKYGPRVLGRAGISTTPITVVGTTVGAVGMYRLSRKKWPAHPNVPIALGTAGGVVGYAFPISTTVATAIINKKSRSKMIQAWKWAQRKWRLYRARRR